MFLKALPDGGTNIRIAWKGAINPVDVLMTRQKVNRRFLANARNPRNIVRGISGQPLEVDELPGRKPSVALANRLFVIDDNVRHFGRRAASQGIDNNATAFDKLQRVAVSRGNNDLNGTALVLFNQRSYNIVRFKARFFQNRNAEGTQHFFHNRDLPVEFLVRRGSRPFILFEGFVPKRWTGKVESCRNI